MTLAGKKIGVGVTGSFCTISNVIDVLKELKEKGADIYPIASENVTKFDTRFGKAEDFIKDIEEISGKKVVTTVVEAEKFGPSVSLDLMVLFPLTGSSLGKFANGINDNAPLMAAKATLRNQKPVTIGIYTNDALGISGENIFKLLNCKNIYFVPFGQDDYVNKPKSMTSKVDLVVKTIEMALENKQIQPVIVENFAK